MQLPHLSGRVQSLRLKSQGTHSDQTDSSFHGLTLSVYTPRHAPSLLPPDNNTCFPNPAPCFLPHCPPPFHDPPTPTNTPTAAEAPQKGAGPSNLGLGGCGSPDCLRQGAPHYCDDWRGGQRQCRYMYFTGRAQFALCLVHTCMSLNLVCLKVLC